MRRDRVRCCHDVRLGRLRRYRFPDAPTVVHAIHDQPKITKRIQVAAYCPVAELPPS